MFLEQFEARQLMAVVDDLDTTGYSATSGFGSGAYVGYNGFRHQASGDSSGDKATFTIGGLAAGTYRVSTTWPAAPSNTAAAPFTVSSGGVVLATATVDQRVAPNDTQVSGAWWEDLGTGIYTIAGGDLTIVVSDQTTGFVMADAVRVDPWTGPEVHVTTNGVKLDDNSGVVDFGTAASWWNVEKTFTVKNAGVDSPLTLGSPSVPSGFTLASGLGSTTLQPGESTSFTVRLDTSSTGTKSGQVSLTTNDANENPFNFTVNGIVNNYQVIDDQATAGFTSTAGFGSGAYAGYNGFRRHATGDSSGDKATWTFNDLPTGSYRVTGTWPAAPSNTAAAPFTVRAGGTLLGSGTVDQRSAPNDVQTLGVWWEDLGTGIYTTAGGALSVEFSDQATGFVMADAIRIEPWSGPEVHVTTNGTKVDDNSGVIDFGTAASWWNVEKTFNVWNAGVGSALTLGSLSLPSGFTLVSGLGSQTLQPGQSTSFTVRLDTSVTGTKSGQISLATNDGNENPFNFTVNGVVNNYQIVDDLDPSTFTYTAGFGTGAFVGYNTYFHYASGDGSGDKATWTFNNLPVGVYRVSATWPAQSFASTSSPFTVRAGGTTIGTASLNQQVAPNDFQSAGVWWEDIGAGSYSVGSSPLTVEARDQAVNYVLADAIRIELLNAAPTAVNDQISVHGWNATTVAAPGVLANDIDREGGSLTPSTVAAPQHGTLTWQTGGAFTYTPTRDGATSDSFQYRVSDGTTNSGVATVQLALTGLAPEISVLANGSELTSGGSLDFGSTPVGTPVQKTLTVRNDGTGFLTINAPATTITGGVELVSLSTTSLAPGASASLVLRLPATSPGPVTGSLSLASDDSDESHFVVNFSGNVPPPNSAPVASTIADRNVDEDGTLDGIALRDFFADFEDPDSDLAFAVSSSNPGLLNLSLNSTTDELLVDLLADAHGMADVTITAKDTGNLTTSTTFRVSVAAVNDAPAAANKLVAVDAARLEMGQEIGQIIVTDPDDDAHTYEFLAGNENGELIVDDTGRIVVIDAGAFDFTAHGVYEYTLRVTDGGGLSATATFAVIPAAGHAPIGANTFAVLGASAPAVLNEKIGEITFEDLDAGDTFTFSILSGNDDGALEVTAAGDVIVGDAVAFNAIDSLRTLEVLVQDQNGRIGLAEFTLLPKSVFSISTAEVFNQNQASSIKLDSPVSTAEWAVNWGDGIIERYANGAEPTHTYQSPGQFTISASVVGAGANAVASSEVVVTQAEGVNLVVNGGFEADIVEPSAGWDVFQTIVAWQYASKIKPSIKFELQRGAVLTAVEGMQSIELDADETGPDEQAGGYELGSMGIMQYVATSPGVAYDFSFLFAARNDAPGDNKVTVKVTGATDRINTAVTSELQAWERHEFSFVADSYVTQIQLVDDGAEKTNTKGSLLDDVQLRRKPSAPTQMTFDLDIDGDNNNNLGSPEGSPWEEELEATDYALGKLVVEGADSYTPMVLRLPVDLDLDAEDIRIGFVFEETSAAGEIRIFRKDKSQSPVVSAIETVGAEGDLVTKAGKYSLRQLGYDKDTGEIKLFIQGVKENTSLHTMKGVEKAGKPQDKITAVRYLKVDNYPPVPVAVDWVRYMVVQRGSFYHDLQFIKPFRMAITSRDVYEPKNVPTYAMQYVTGQGLDNLDLPSEVVGLLNNNQALDPVKGFEAGLYRDYMGTAKTYILAFAGTNEVADVANDIWNAAGLFSPQYKAAIIVGARLASSSEVFDSLTFTGHSLGGGLASAAAVAGGKYAITFNAAGVSEYTFAEFNEVTGKPIKVNGELIERIPGLFANLSSSANLVDAYYIRMDILSNVQDTIAALPDAYGDRKVLTGPYVVNGLQGINQKINTEWGRRPWLKPTYKKMIGIVGAPSNVKDVVNMVKSHSMDAVIFGLFEDAKWQQGVDNVMGYSF